MANGLSQVCDAKERISLLNQEINCLNLVCCCAVEWWLGVLLGGGWVCCWVVVGCVLVCGWLGEGIGWSVRADG